MSSTRSIALPPPQQDLGYVRSRVIDPMFKPEVH